MVKIIILLISLLLVVGCTELDVPEPFVYETTNVILGNVAVNVQIADTPEKMVRGLM